MSTSGKGSGAWRFIYRTYPPLLRILERLRFHHGRQPYLLGRLAVAHTPEELNDHLASQGFEPAVLAWKDGGEILSVRRIDGQRFQYHLRLFSDRALHGHYEYSSEGNPWGHITEKVFEPREAFFKELLGEYLA